MSAQWELPKYGDTELMFNSPLDVFFVQVFIVWTTHVYWCRLHVSWCFCCTCVGFSNFRIILSALKNTLLMFPKTGPLHVHNTCTCMCAHKKCASLKTNYSEYLQQVKYIVLMSMVNWGKPEK